MPLIEAMHEKMRGPPPCTSRAVHLAGGAPAEGLRRALAGAVSVCFVMCHPFPNIPLRRTPVLTPPCTHLPPRAKNRAPPRTLYTQYIIILVTGPLVVLVPWSI